MVTMVIVMIWTLPNAIIRKNIYTLRKLFERLEILLLKKLN